MLRTKLTPDRTLVWGLIAFLAAVFVIGLIGHEQAKALTPQTPDPPVTEEPPPRPPPPDVPFRPQRPPNCEEETRFFLGPDRMDWRITRDRRHIRVNGVVQGTFEGMCQGLATIRIRFLRAPNGHCGDFVTPRYRKAAKRVLIENREFKNGYRDTGQPYEFSVKRRIKRFRPGDCFTVVMRATWRFDELEPFRAQKISVITQNRCPEPIS